MNIVPFKIMIRLILILVFLILYLILSLPFLAIERLIARKNRYAADIARLHVVQWAFKVVLFFSGTHLTVIGEEHVPKDCAVLYIGNHRSFFDIVITYARCPRLTGYIAKDSIKKIPLLSLWMKRLYCLFLNRDDVKEGLKTILTGIEQIKNGISMCIFPEGTRPVLPIFMKTICPGFAPLMSRCNMANLSIQKSFQKKPKRGWAVIPKRLF